MAGILLDERAARAQRSTRRGRRGRAGNDRDRATWRSTLTGWAFAGPATLIILGLSIFPAGWAFFISLQKTDLITPPSNVGFANYQRMAQDPDMIAAAWHTAFYAAMYVPTSVIGGLVLAIALNRPIRFQWFYRTCIFVPFVASAAATGILANFVFDEKFGAANNLLRLLHLPQQGFLTDRHQAMMVIVIISLWVGRLLRARVPRCTPGHPAGDRGGRHGRRCQQVADVPVRRTS